ncbi:JAB domain-containing protein [Flaviaesturariibacter aridisoli]|uniref:DNA repair protein n=1 Tax=Flaviaesturariibacter aridisoli TaxID=2545761 RepID=A0A4R4E2Z7_9BACT|nr:JAB domain-containing protein [Flaviaesturariibacter aridisoli]TCZ73287.1 DNA repair protein [Flaviaesturariibacter aridisoli]
MKKTTQRVSEIRVSYRPRAGHKPLIQTSQDAFNELHPFFPSQTIALQERVVALYLNRANRVLGAYEVSKGGISGTVVDARLILSVGLKVACSGIILGHNHPSGNPTPSQQDLELTARLREACKLVDMRLLDHLILIPDGRFQSLADEGYL